jgi:Integrase core domain
MGRNGTMDGDARVPAASPCATTTDRNICPTPSSTSSPFSASRAHPRACAPRNGCAERFICTLKENLLWVRSFETIEQLRQALLEFRDTYNTTWLIERHGFIPPAAFRQRQVEPAALAA